LVFSSVVFLFYFLPAFLFLYLILPPFRTQIILTGSLVFYAWGDPGDVPVLLAFIVFNWAMGIFVAGARRRKRFVLFVGCAVNVGVLLYFKYAGFLAAQLDPALSAAGFAPLGLAARTLPLGISFFTFQGISYLIDISRGVIVAQRGLLKFAMYKSMFPQLIAGPIVRYSQIAAEIDDRTVREYRLAFGVQYFIVGLAQKVLIANTVAVAADAIFGLPDRQLTIATAWLGAWCYMAQIYFDFGGYSNMAIGLGHMIGFTLPRNFDNPYAARSMTEFWRRWHITLSTWFRDYLYIPLGGNRRGRARTYVNLFVTFLLCGLWHGAAWNFAVWGLFHGAFLAAERAFSRFGRRVPWRPPRHGYTLLVVLTGWVVFRADSLGRAAAMLRTMAGAGRPDDTAWPVQRFATHSVLAALAASALIVVLAAWRPIKFVPIAARWQPVWEGARVASLLAMFVLSAAALSSGTYNPFIYFRF
jgi:alginate O-acetyltransferase complex protein AlgI